jgi:hypothetical protein
MARLRAKGLTFQQIGDGLGVTRQAVEHALSKANAKAMTGGVLPGISFSSGTIFRLSSVFARPGPLRRSFPPRSLRRRRQ